MQTEIRARVSKGKELKIVPLLDVESVKSTGRDDRDDQTKNVKYIFTINSDPSRIILCLGILCGALISMFIHHIDTKPIQNVHKNVKHAYYAHKEARKDYLKRYREAYLESKLSLTNSAKIAENFTSTLDEDSADSNIGSRSVIDPEEKDEYGIPLKTSWFTHVHIAKTAGSTFSNKLSRRYYGVCGNKDFSCIEPFEDDPGNAPPFGQSVGAGRYFDDMNYDNMTKRGWHNCDIVSEERTWSQWPLVILPSNNNFHENATKVMLLPCREPVEHYFSLCNFDKKNLTQKFADGKSCEEVVNTNLCLYHHDRFDMKMLQHWDKVVLFKHSAFDSVFRLLDNHLPVRKFLLKSEVDPKTNAPRKPENEHLNKCSKSDLARALKKQWPYYEICERLRGDLTVLSLVNGTVI
jgi:hypothetical protein